MTKEQEQRTAKGICLGITALGYKAYLAGGCVRDLILGRIPKDFDIASDCPSEVLKREFRTFDAGGEKYGVTHILIDNTKFEVAIFREDGEYTDGRRPDSIKIATPETDAKRRDFTINALFLDPLTNQIIDYVDGRGDLEKRLIRTVGDPLVRFSEDHLRLMRAIRFYSELDFCMEARTVTAIRENCNLIKDVSGERIRIELMKILNSPAPDRGLTKLFDCGLLQHILPEIVDFIGCQQPPQFHPEGDVWKHTMTMLYLMDPEKEVDPLFPLAVLLHDVGKPSTQTFEEGRFRFHFHEEAGEKMCDPIMRRLAFSNQEIETVQFLVGNHMRIKHLREMRPSKKKKLMRHPLFFNLMELHRLDCVSSNKPDDSIERFLEEARNTPPEQLRPKALINGDDLIEIGFQPGPLMGEILRAVEDAQLEETIVTKDEALAFAKTYTRETKEDNGNQLGGDDD